MYTAINLRSHPAAPAKAETPVQELIACHERIRHFTVVARRIAEACSIALEQVADAAADVYRYFTVALPLHEADENLSIDPRLEAALPDSEIAQASREMVRQHSEIRTVLNMLFPLWDALCREPEKLPAFAPRLLELSAEFDRLWDIHLKLEEETVFPAVERTLDAATQAEIMREMRERRQ